MENFNTLKEQDSLTTLMEYNGEKIRVLPKTCKVIFPEAYQNMTYNPKTDSFIIEPSLITNSMAQKLGDKLMVGGKDSRGNIMQMVNYDNEIVYGSDIDNSIANSSAVANTDEDYQTGGGINDINDKELEDIEKEERK